MNLKQGAFVSVSGVCSILALASIMSLVHGQSFAKVLLGVLVSLGVGLGVTGIVSFGVLGALVIYEELANEKGVIE